MNCPNPKCNTKNLPIEARFCPNCGEKILPPAMVVKSCKITPKSVTLGEECLIQWRGDNVQHVIIDNVKYTEKSIKIQPKTSQTIAVTFVGLDETTINMEVAIDVVIPKPIIRVSAPKIANIGDKIEIKWSAKHVARVVVEGVNYTPKDKIALQHQSSETKCEILFYGLDGSIKSKIVKVREALPAVIETCALGQECITENAPITIVWKGNNVVKWEINGEEYASDINSQTIPYTSKKIKVVFYGEDSKIIEKELTPNVFKINYCTLDKSMIYEKESVLVKWSAQNTKSVKIFGEQQKETGSYTWFPKETGVATCDVEFVGQNGKIKSKTLTINVLPEPKILRFELEGDDIVWDTIGMEECFINNNKIKSLSGRFKINKKMISSGCVLLDCCDKRGNHYTAELPPKIISCHANKLQLFKGQKTTITWSTFGMTKVVLDGVEQDKKGMISIPILTDKINLLCWGKNNKHYLYTINFELSEKRKVNFEVSTKTFSLADALLDAEKHAPVIDSVETLQKPDITLYAEETSVYKGKSTTIRWNCKYVQKVKLNGELVKVSGHKTMFFDQVGQHRITLTAEDMTGKPIKPWTVQVNVQEDKRLMEFFLSIIGSVFTCGIFFIGTLIGSLFKENNKKEESSGHIIVGSLIGAIIMWVTLSII